MTTPSNTPAPDATGAIPAFIGPANKTPAKKQFIARHWCMTLNNPVLTGPEYLEELIKHPHLRYVVFQLESGDNDTPHFQAYMEFNTPKTLTSLKKLEPRAHWEARRGTRVQARDYCMKDESRIEGPWEGGDWKAGGGGARVDLHEACALVKERGLSALIEDRPTVYVKYSRGFEKLDFQLRGKRDKAPRVILHYGPTGTFKTGLVLNRHPDAYKKPPGTKWFDGYTGQKVLLLDDFAGASSGVRLDWTLQLLDRYDIDVEMKGGHCRLMAETIYVTTNIHPSAWFDYTTRGGQYRALARRFHEVILFEAFDLRPRRITKDSFFEDWHEGCDEDLVLIDWSVKEEVSRLPQWLLADQECIDLVSSDDELSYSGGPGPHEPPHKRQKLTRTHPGHYFTADELATLDSSYPPDEFPFVAETQSTPDTEEDDDVMSVSRLLHDLNPDASSDDSVFDDHVPFGAPG